MSNSLALATVTATLKHLLKPAVLGMDTPRLSTQPLDKARRDSTSNQLNIFLYQTGINPAWRNRDMPNQTRPNETGRPPLPLNLHYLITAYGKADQDLLAHGILGQAMNILHDHPQLSPADVRAAIAEAAADAEMPVDLSGSDLADQIERVRFSWHPLALDELSKLWGGLQTQFRLSAAYEASVVLIESGLSARAPLPVLQRGQGDRGVDARGSLVPPYPALEDVLLRMPPPFAPNPLPLPDKITSPIVGDTLELKGRLLGGSPVIARFSHLRLEDPIEIDLTARPDRTDDTLVVPLDPALGWAAGHYTVSVEVTPPGETHPRTASGVSFPLAPVIVGITPANPVPRDADGAVTLTVRCSPVVLPSQRASLLFGGPEYPAEPHPAATDTLTFVIPGATPGDVLPRLRIDGVDSLVVDRTVQPPRFDPTHQVTI
jgi:hypothetical protein